MRKVRTVEPEGFAEFWATWQPYMRHTDGRGDARERYRREILEHDAQPADMIDGAKAFIRNLLSLPERERGFIPLAASWLHKQAYLDWCEKERAYQSRISERENNVVAMAPRPAGKTAFLESWEGRKAASDGPQT